MSRFLRTKLGKATVLIGFGLLLALLVLEIGAQAYIRLAVFRDFDRAIAQPNCYFEASPNPILGFQIKRNFNADVEGRHLHTNTHGLREDTDDVFPDRRRIAILGDSLVFGTGLDQAQTLPARLQALVDPGTEKVKVLNIAAPGYSLEELPEQLRICAGLYKPHAVLYVFNPNDFAQRHSLYEGGDNGAYKMFNRPLLMTPWALRKIVYRARKDGIFPSFRWYDWMYRGTRESIYPRFLEMRDLARKCGFEFTVVLLPMKTTMTKTGNLLDPEYAEIGAYAAKNGIRLVDLSNDPIWGTKPIDEWMDQTDHYIPLGAEMAARVIKARVLDAATGADASKGGATPGTSGH